MTYFLSADPKSLQAVAILMVAFFIVVTALAFLSNYLYRVRLRRMKYALQRAKRLEKLYSEVFGKPMIAKSHGRVSVLRDDGTWQVIGNLTKPPEFYIDPEYLDNLNQMSPKDRDKWLYGSFAEKEEHEEHCKLRFLGHGPEPVYCDCKLSKEEPAAKIPTLNKHGHEAHCNLM